MTIGEDEGQQSAGSTGSTSGGCSINGRGVDTARKHSLAEYILRNECDRLEGYRRLPAMKMVMIMVLQFFAANDLDDALEILEIGVIRLQRRAHVICILLTRHIPS